MTHAIRGLVVKIAERCNLNCTYCYMYQHEDQSYTTRPKFMSPVVFASLSTRVADYTAAHQTEMGVVMHGGEPMLYDARILDGLLDDARLKWRDRVSLGMQTNATLVSPEWVRLLQKHKVRISVSLDGPEGLHDVARVDHAGRGSHSRVLGGLRRLQDADLTPGVLCVINPRHDGLEIYEHLVSLGIKRMNFLMPEATHDTRARLFDDLPPRPVSKFLIPIFDRWFETDDETITIRLFDELIRILLGGTSRVEAVGNTPLDYLVVDTDGSLQTNDCLKVCYSGAPETGLNVRAHGFDQLREGNELAYRLVTEGLPLPTACSNCRERKTCAGGAITQRYSQARGFDNASVWCDDLLELITHIRGALSAAMPTLTLAELAHV